jgi:PAS domain S-box-containing protein
MSETPPLKSVITCDLEGRIETFGKDAEAIFGYRADEIIGKQRVSYFSPGLVVLGHVGGWLKEAREKGEFTTRTVFLRKGGAPFAAEIKITPTMKHGVQIGYCGVTVPLDVPPETVAPPISRATRLFKWLVILRAPFLTATLVPVIAGIALARPLAPAGRRSRCWRRWSSSAPARCTCRRTCGTTTSTGRAARTRTTPATSCPSRAARAPSSSA